ncbi:DnaJ-like protein subfamily C member 7-like protein [Diplonema papillatum]|nr:DnaJ-like protein subfamily C member 7-like protein [Diplonema papillatum]
MDALAASIGVSPTTLWTAVVGAVCVAVLYHDVSKWLRRRLQGLRPRPAPLAQRAAAGSGKGGSANSSSNNASGNANAHSTARSNSTSSSSAASPSDKKQPPAAASGADGKKQAAGGSPDAAAAAAAAAATESTQQQQQQQQPQAAPVQKKVTPEDAALESLLSAAVKEIDEEEAIADQAWDQCFEKRQVSTFVDSGLQTMLNNTMKSFTEASKSMNTEKLAEAQRRQKAEYVQRQAKAAFNKGALSEAYTLYSHAIRLTPDDAASKPELLSSRSSVLHRLKRYNEALADADQCLKLDSSSVTGYMRRGAALEAKGEWGEAKCGYQHVVDKFPDHLLAKTASFFIERCDKELDSVLDDM